MSLDGVTPPAAPTGAVAFAYMTPQGISDTGWVDMKLYNIAASLMEPPEGYSWVFAFADYNKGAIKGDAS